LRPPARALAGAAEDPERDDLCSVEHLKDAGDRMSDAATADDGRVVV